MNYLPLIVKICIDNLLEIIDHCAKLEYITDNRQGRYHNVRKIQLFMFHFYVMNKKQKEKLNGKVWSCDLGFVTEKQQNFLSNILDAQR